MLPANPAAAAVRSAWKKRPVAVMRKLRLAVAAAKNLRTAIHVVAPVVRVTNLLC